MSIELKMIQSRHSWSPAMPMQNHMAISPCKLGLIHTKQLLSMKFCDTLAGIEVSFQTTRTKTGMEPRMDGRTNGQTDVEVEIVI